MSLFLSSSFKLKDFFKQCINVFKNLYQKKTDITSVEKFFLIIYLLIVFFYLFFNLMTNGSLSLGVLIFNFFKIILSMCLIIGIFFILKKIINYLLEDVENVFEENYFFSLTKKHLKPTINEFKNFKEFLEKKRQLFVKIQNNIKNKSEYLKVLILYPDYLDNKEKTKIIEEFEDYFALFSIYFFRKNDNLKKILQNIMIINLLVFVVIIMGVMIIHLKGKYFQTFGDFGTILIKIIILTIIILSYFNFLIGWNQKYNPSKIKSIYVDLKKDLYINIDIFTVYIIDIYFNKEQKFTIRQLLCMIEKEIDEKYIKTLEITLQVLLAISFIGALTIFSGLL